MNRRTYGGRPGAGIRAMDMWVMDLQALDLSEEKGDARAARLYGRWDFRAMGATVGTR